MQSTSTHQKIAMVILAAGNSSRMKAIKQLLPWKDTTLIGNAIEQGLKSKIDTVYVVLGANKEKILPELAQQPVTIIENKNWQQGMGSSIAVVMTHIKKHQLTIDAVLFSLIDQPLLEAPFYNQLITEYKNNDFGIVATKRFKKAGVPALFNVKYFDELATLNQDIGAKHIINEHQKDVLIIDANNKNIDLDTLDDYTTYYNTHGMK